MAAVAKRLGLSYESLRRWVNLAEVDTGVRDGVPSDVVRENRELKRKNRELEGRIQLVVATPRSFGGVRWFVDSKQQTEQSVQS